VIDNVCYRHMGHGYFLEDGAEEDTVFDGNLAVSTLRGTGNVEPMDLGYVTFNAIAFSVNS